MKKQLASMLGILAVCAAMAQTDRPITFSSPGERTAVLLPKTGRLMGLKLEASPSTASDVLVVRFVNVPGQEILAKLSATLDADWQTRGSTTYLARSAFQERKKHETELRRRAEACKLGQLQLEEKLEKLGPFDANTASKLAGALADHLQHPVGNFDSMRNAKVGAELDAQGPAMRVLDQLILSLPSE